MKKLLLTILKCILFFGIWAVGVAVFPSLPITEPAFLRLWLEFVPCAITVILSAVFCKLIEKGAIHIPIFKQPIKNASIGLFTGIVWLGTCVIVLMFTGSLQYQSMNSVPHLFTWIVAVLINVVMQELLVRGYLYQLIRSNYNTIVAILCTTALFALMHGGAFEAGIVPALNVVTMSLFISVMLEYTGSLLAPILAHFLWNAVGGVILGAISLAEDYPHLLNMQFGGNELLAGGAYKLEGSVVVLAVNIILGTIFAILAFKKQRKVVMPT